MRISALTLRILRQFIHDKRTLALMLLAPMLILTLMSFVFNGNAYHPKIGAIDLPKPFVENLVNQGAQVTSFTNTAGQQVAEQRLKANTIDAIISLDNGSPKVLLEGSDPSVSKSVILLLQKTIQKSSPTAGLPVISYLHGSETMAAFDNFGPVLIGFFAFFFVFIIAGVSFLRERTGGTLERLLSTPIRRVEIVIGYVSGFGIFTLLQAILIASYSIFILNMLMVGSIWYVLLITVLLTMTALTLGIFLSAFANNEFQMIQFIPLIVVPQVFFSGLFNMDSMAEWLRWIGVIMPLSYGADALRNIMIRGNGWAYISKDVYVLIAFSLIFMTANVLALRKHRRI